MYDDTAHAQHTCSRVGPTYLCLIQMGMLLEAEPTCRLNTIQHTCNTLQLHGCSTLAIRYSCSLHFYMCLPTVRSSLPVFDRGGVLDVTCLSALSCLSVLSSRLAPVWATAD